jgi:hypothetical protein
MIDKPSITREDIDNALSEIESETFARFVGLMAHLVYWTVFEDINQVPLDDLHKKDLFIGVMQIKTQFEMKYAGK